MESRNHCRISCLYYVFSALPMKTGASLTMNANHDKNTRNVEVRVEGMETLGGPRGKADTVWVLVIMPFQGLFINQGNSYVWFTTDDRRTFLRIKAQVVIGSIVADLVDGLSENNPAKQKF